MHCSHFITIKIHFKCSCTPDNITISIHSVRRDSGCAGLCVCECCCAQVRGLARAIRWRIIRLFICSLCSFRWENIALWQFFFYFALCVLFSFNRRCSVLHSRLLFSRHSICFHFCHPVCGRCAESLLLAHANLLLSYVLCRLLLHFCYLDWRTQMGKWAHNVVVVAMLSRR